MDCTFAELLRRENKSRLARELNVSRGTVHAWMRGEQVPSVRMLPAMARILRVDLGDLTRAITAEAA